MITRIFVLLALAFLVPERASAAGAQCGPPDAVLKGLHDQYEEVPVFSGNVPSGAPMVITASPKGTWTILVYQTPEVICAMAAGENWAAAKSEGAKPAEPSVLPAPVLLPNGQRRI